MKRVIAPVLAAGLMFPAFASTQELNYNYIQGGAAFYPSFEDQDFIGIDVKGSVLVTEEIFAFGGMKFLTDDVDLTAIHVGGGYRFPLAERTDVWGGVTLE